MTITDRMISVKKRLAEEDREAAIAALTEHVYRVVRPRAAGAHRYALFESEGQKESFCAGARIDRTALSWLTDRMAEEGLL
ncbi:MAG: hypothetical protein LBL73_07025 [Synergistaceae bacterium]|jgi:hypothetical protein|nr:hypothetical protein [Synergistaceae bacterium]